MKPAAHPKRATASRRSTPLLVATLAIPLLWLLPASTANAYGWMIKHGRSRCSGCHVDPSGGETLTPMGRAEAERLLSLEGTAVGFPNPISRFAFGTVASPRWLQAGGSYRHLLVVRAPDAGAPGAASQFPMQLDGQATARVGELVVGMSLGVARGITGSGHARGAQLNREMGKGWLLLSRSHWVGLQLGTGTLLRAGRLGLPFGLRVPEHVLWVREATRTDRESDHQHGMSLFHEQGRLRVESMLVAGNYQTYPDRFRERGYAAQMEYLVTETTALGLSSFLLWSNEDRFTQQRNGLRQAHGLTARFGASPRVSVLAEVDLLGQSQRNPGYVALLQADYEPLRGLHLTLTTEVLDQGLPRDSAQAAPGLGEPRLGAWASVSVFALSHFDARLDLVQRQNAPATAFLQLHVLL